MRSAMGGLALLAALGGCDVIEKARDLGRHPPAELEKFGMATRTRIDDEHRVVFEAMVEAKADASWGEALTAIGMQDGLRCDDGGPLTPISTEPVESDGYLARDFDKTYPAGTHFRYVFLCTARYPRTATYPRDLDHAEQAGRMAAAFRDEHPGEHQVQWRAGRYGYKRTKYDAVMLAIGSLLMEARHSCATGSLLVRDMALLEEEPDPDPPLGRHPPMREFMVGGILDCQAPAPAP